MKKICWICKKAYDGVHLQKYCRDCKKKYGKELAENARVRLRLQAKILLAKENERKVFAQYLVSREKVGEMELLYQELEKNPLQNYSGG